MDFDYNDDERLLRDEARRFLADACPPSVARRILEDSDHPFDRDLWDMIAALGWLGVAIPEAYGGLGLGRVALAAIAEEIGAALAPIPFGSTLYLFADAVLLGGTEQQRGILLPKIVAGEVIGCAALFEGAGDLQPGTIEARVVDGRLTGCKKPVIDGSIATHAVVLARDTTEVRLFLVSLDAPGVIRTTLDAIDGSSDVAEVTFDRAPASALGDARLADVLLDRAAALYAFEQVGGSDRCLAATLDFVRVREAFGGPVGRFQAVKHKLADLYVANQLARSHAYHGIWASEANDSLLPQAAAAARVAASDAYWQASKEAIQLHGAIGFTWEHDAHLFYRRAHHLSLSLGSPGWWRDRLFDALAAGAHTAGGAPVDEYAVAAAPISPESG